MKSKIISSGVKNKRLGIIGAGFWADPQIAAWKELKGINITAICDNDRNKASKVAIKYNIPRIYKNAAGMLQNEKLDFVDIITPPDTHEGLVNLAVDYHIPVICQKPMSNSHESAKSMVHNASKAKVQFYVHENWRWQRPIREVKKILDSKKLGKIFRADISYCNNFPVFINQPFLKNLGHFILMDMGTHILDTARFLFGEAKSIYCRTASVTQGIKGEDVASISLLMRDNMICDVKLSYATKTEPDTFPQTFIKIEGENGSIDLSLNYTITTLIKGKWSKNKYPPVKYSWTTPRYELVQSSIVSAHQNFLDALNGITNAETSAADNLQSLELVFAAYKSSAENKVIEI